MHYIRIRHEISRVLYLRARTLGIPSIILAVFDGWPPRTSRRATVVTPMLTLYGSSTS